MQLLAEHVGVMDIILYITLFKNNEHQTCNDSVLASVVSR